jgi:hypothetical protein
VIRRTALYLLNEAIDRIIEGVGIPNYFLETGGLRVQFSCTDKLVEESELRLMFVGNSYDHFMNIK